MSFEYKPPALTLLQNEGPVVYRSVSHAVRDDHGGAGGLAAMDAGSLAMPSLSSFGAAAARDGAGKKTLDSLSFPSWSTPKSSSPLSSPPPQLRAVPVYVEPSSFEVSSTYTPAQVLQTIIDQFTLRNDLSCTVLSAEFRIKAVLATSPSGELIHFRVHLFRAASGGVLIEFQRRTGNCLTFGYFVRAMRSALQQKLPNTAAAAAEASPLPAAVESNSTVDHAAVMLAILAMATSSAAETEPLSAVNASDGWALLARICATAATAPTEPHVRSQLLTALHSAFQSTDLEIRVYAAQVLAGLARWDSLRAELIPLLPQIAAVVFHLSPDSTVDEELLQREALRSVCAAVALIGSTHAELLGSAVSGAAAAAASVGSKSSAEQGHSLLQQFAVGQVAVESRPRVMVV